MPITLRSQLQNVTLNDLEARRIRRQLRRLASQLQGWPEPIATLLLSRAPRKPSVSARVRVRLGHLGGHLVGSQLADTADQAVRGALAEIRRQLERRQAIRRGTPAFGVPSRRAPRLSSQSGRGDVVDG